MKTKLNLQMESLSKCVALPPSSKWHDYKNFFFFVISAAANEARIVMPDKFFHDSLIFVSMDGNHFKWKVAKLKQN